MAQRASVGLSMLVCLFVGSATPARAYVCADAMSFVFFIGAVCAVLLIPVAFGRREELPPE
jgi:hypothetical protein